MADITEDARRDVARKRLESFDTDAVLAAYAEVDDLVVQDVLNTFHERNNPDVEEGVAVIDHPYRLYFIEGQRSVARAFRDTVAAARAKHVTGEDSDVPANDDSV